MCSLQAFLIAAAVQPRKTQNYPSIVWQRAYLGKMSSLFVLSPSSIASIFDMNCRRAALISPPMVHRSHLSIRTMGMRAGSSVLKTSPRHTSRYPLDGFHLSRRKARKKRQSSWIHTQVGMGRTTCYRPIDLLSARSTALDRSCSCAMSFF